MKTTFTIAIIAALFCSCSSTNLMTLSVQNPSPVSVPSTIKNVAVVNRSRATEETSSLDAIHRTLNLESKDLVIEGSKSSIDALQAELLKNPRFANIKYLDKLDLRSYGSGVFPAPMAWDSIEAICRKNNVDAVFSLELFDTESKLNYEADKSTVQIAGTNIPVIKHYVGMNTLVKTGWRIYDPNTRTILDEFIISREISTGGESINPAVAASVLVGKKEAVKQVGYNAGTAYAGRILPYWVRVSRDYFTSGNDQLEMANRKAKSGNWDGAGEIWLQETKNQDPKVAGRACYNMAIISEINGDLSSAITWAQRSYENYKVNLALFYLNILKNRKTQNELLESQQVATN
jgi:hypothetical protein